MQECCCEPEIYIRDEFKLTLGSLCLHPTCEEHPCFLSLQILSTEAHLCKVWSAINSSGKLCLWLSLIKLEWEEYLLKLLMRTHHSQRGFCIALDCHRQQCHDLLLCSWESLVSWNRDEFVKHALSALATWQCLRCDMWQEYQGAVITDHTMQIWFEEMAFSWWS